MFCALNFVTQDVPKESKPDAADDFRRTTTKNESLEATNHFEAQEEELEKI
jgi:hypothetical protein